MAKYSPPPINFPKAPINNPYNPDKIYHQPRPSDNDPYQPPKTEFPKTASSFNPQPNNFPKTPPSFNPQPNNFPKTPSSFNPQPTNLTKTPSNPFNPQPINFLKQPSSFNPQPINFPKLPSSFNPQPINLTKIPSNPFNPQKSSKTSITQAYLPKENSNKNGWALTKFLFEVDLGMDTNIGFQTCEGLETGIEAYEFRDGNSTDFFKQKRPGAVTFSNVTLKKGMFANDKALYKWYNNVATGALFGDMRTVTIRLLDTDRGIKPTVVFTWKLEKAFVVKYAPTNMDAHDGEEVAVEELEIACQSWTMS
jgi:phage tail-like protein